MKKAVALLITLVLVFALALPALARTVTFGYYGYEPIRWLVLSSDSQYTKLLSEYAIACRPFGGSCNWNNSGLRSWLNNSFAYNAFSSGERNALCYQGADLVVLASLGDMTNPNYGFSTNPDAKDRGRSARGGSQAISEGLWINKDNGCCSYYTLTPNPHDRNTLYQIRSDGSVGVARYDRDNVGVRPVIVVRTSALSGY